MEKYALISVTDKTGIVDFSRNLIKLGYKIISTGGTARLLKTNSIQSILVEELTGNPESFDGRMKTISFQIEAGILFDRSNPSHVREAEEFKIKSIDIIVCNLYPFEKTIKKVNSRLEEAIENIDVGGPTMIRAAAKNFKNVLVVIDPADYGIISEYLKGNSLTEEIRKAYAAKAFGHIAFYDSQIAMYLSTTKFPQEITIPGRKLLDLRYGENPHQKGSAYIRPGFSSSLQNLTRKWGRELSLINLTDINAGLESVRIFKEPAAVVIKHNNPSGIALGKTTDEALLRAIEADPESAFGGIIVVNAVFDIKSAKIISEFKEVRHGNIDLIAAPDFDLESLEYLKSIRKSMGLYSFGNIPKVKDPYNLKWIDGGFIIQDNDELTENFAQWKTVTKKKPTKLQMRQMQIAWKFISRIKSNSVIVLDKDIPMTRGIGSGQTSRVRSTLIALDQAGPLAKEGILASDSFFPFGDSVKLAAERGISAIIQQGGSINDKASIDEADKSGIAMVFTGRRTFWH